MLDSASRAPQFESVSPESVGSGGNDGTDTGKAPSKMTRGSTPSTTKSVLAACTCGFRPLPAAHSQSSAPVQVATVKPKTVNPKTATPEGSVSAFGWLSWPTLCWHNVLCTVFICLTAASASGGACAYLSHGSDGLLPSSIALPDATALPTETERGPLFAPHLAPCGAGFVPTCEQAKGFGLCDTANAACDEACVEEVMMACPVTCSLPAEATSGHLAPDAAPSDYGKHLPPAATEAICSTCAAQPDLPCCHNHPHEGSGRALASESCTEAMNSGVYFQTVFDGVPFCWCLLPDI